MYKATLITYILFSVLLCFKSFSQQELNLGFEKPGVEGNARPWGWAIEKETEGTTSGLDSVVKHGGTHSLHMKSSNPADTLLLTLNLEPYALRNKTVKLAGWIRTEWLSGSAAVHVNYTIDSNDNPLTKKQSFFLKAASGWTPFSITLVVPRQARAVSVSAGLNGAGAAWLDDLGLFVDIKRTNSLEVDEPFTGPQLTWLDSNSRAIGAVDATRPGAQPSYNDLQFFKEKTKGAAIIAFGESTHGSSEFFRLKHRLLDYLVREAGLRIFAIEDNQVVARRVNNYVVNGIGTARGSMYGLFSVWQNQEVLELIKWMRAYNVEHPDDPVEFMGFDMQDPSLALDSLFAFTKQRDAQVFNDLTNLLSDLKNNWKNAANASDSVKKKWNADAEKAMALVLNKKQAWLSTAAGRADTVRVEWGLQYARLIKHYAQHVVSGHLSLYRDVAMAENISWILSTHKPGTRLFVWAHDNHVSRGEHRLAVYNYYNGISMGAHLSKKYKAAYKSFGLFTYVGNYRAQLSYADFKQVNCTLYPGPKGSLDDALHEISGKKNAALLFLDLAKARDQNWFSFPVPIRFANHVCMEYSYWTRFSIPYQFDGIFFIDATTSAMPAAEN